MTMTFSFKQQTLTGPPPKAVVSLLIAALLLLTPAAAVQADNTEADSSDFSANLEIGGIYAESDGDRSFIYPYDPLDSSAVFFLDILNLNPGGRSFTFDFSFTHEEDWNADVRYNHGAAFSIGVGAQEFTHALPHRNFAPAFETPAPPFGSVHVEPEDQDPDDEYRSSIQEYTADFKVRIPSYPAHVRGSGRVFRREGPSQMTYFYRSCSTHICHTNSKTRDLDQETQEYNIGFDSHLGPVDFVYNRNMMTFTDEAADPVDYYGDFVYGRPVAGDYPHHTNPDIESYVDEFKLNTNLTNRTILSLNYSDGERKNEDSEITVDQRHFVAEVSYTLSSRHFFSARYLHDDRGTAEISEEARTVREEIEAATEPGRKENSGEVTYRFRPRPGLHFHSHVQYREITRDDYEASNLPEKTTVTTADIDGHFRVSSSLDLEAELARDWTADPAYATDFTDRWRYALGATWAPAPAFTLLARYSGFTGTNDDAAALERGYYDPETLDENFERDSTGHNFLALGTWMAAEDLTFVLSYNYSRNDIEQDQVIGTARYPDLSFRSEGNPFESLYQIGRLEAVWGLTNQLRLTCGGMVIAGEETWDPEIDGRPELTEGLSAIARHEFAKYMVDAEASYDFSQSLSLSLAGYYADYDDKTDDAGDGSGGGVMATVSKRW
jgi:hypothetical protein